MMCSFTFVRSAVGRDLLQLQAGQSRRNQLRSAECRALEPARSAIQPTDCSERLVQHRQGAIVALLAEPV
eukprot:6575027-Pyramimonas_sp.AAC.1